MIVIHDRYWTKKSTARIFSPIIRTPECRVKKNLFFDFSFIIIIKETNYMINSSIYRYVAVYIILSSLKCSLVLVLHKVFYSLPIPHVPSKNRKSFSTSSRVLFISKIQKTQIFLFYRFRQSLLYSKESLS